MGWSLRKRSCLEEERVTEIASCGRGSESALRVIRVIGEPRGIFFVCPHAYQAAEKVGGLVIFDLYQSP